MTEEIAEQTLTSDEAMLNLMWANLEASDGDPVTLAMSIDMLLEQSGGEETDMIRFLQWLQRNEKWPEKFHVTWRWLRAITDEELRMRHFLPYEFFWGYLDENRQWLVINDSKSEYFPTVMHFLYVALQRLEFRDASSYEG